MTEPVLAARLRALLAEEPGTVVAAWLFGSRALQIAIQATLDVASHLVSDRRLGEPRTNRELFTLLVRGSVLPEDLAERLGAMAGFRNVLVHGYRDLDLAVVEDIVENRIGDLLDFVREVRRRTS